MSPRIHAPSISGSRSCETSFSQTSREKLGSARRNSRTAMASSVSYETLSHSDERRYTHGFCEVSHASRTSSSRSFTVSFASSAAWPTFVSRAASAAFFIFSNIGLAAMREVIRSHAPIGWSTTITSPYRSNGSSSSASPSSFRALAAFGFPSCTRFLRSLVSFLPKSSCAASLVSSQNVAMYLRSHDRNLLIQCQVVALALALALASASASAVAEPAVAERTRPAWTSAR
mmetsp:Transcript_49052/g.138847  ORF Transcript_49052/g.138847 Transcript_49052/m.138847 type:complete len:231 (-) Transcript_49052:856-1548(-)